MKSIKVCEYSRSRSFHDDLILQDQASGERSQDPFATISDISLQTLPGFLPLSVKRPRHYLATAVLIFNMEV